MFKCSDDLVMNAPCTLPGCRHFPLIDSRNSDCVELHTCQRYGKNNCGSQTYLNFVASCKKRQAFNLMKIMTS